MNILSNTFILPPSLQVVNSLDVAYYNALYPVEYRLAQPEADTCDYHAGACHCTAVSC